jgi:peroxiredoxin Q/BCP
MPLIEPGRSAPGFTLKDHQGKTHTLKQYAGRIVVVFFYPRSDSPSCITQACQFRDHFRDFTKIKATVLAVSPDGVEAAAQLAAEHTLPFPLLSDPPGPTGMPQTCRDYGVWDEKVLYGRKHMGVVRTTYLINREGKVARRWDHVKVSGHVPMVLEAAKRLHAGERLLDIAGKPVRLPKPRVAKKTRIGDSDPPYSPIRGPGNKSTRGPGARTVRKPVKQTKARGRVG